ncbi:MAG: hypothetical protein RR352_04310 [Clostridia bacterium]
MLTISDGMKHATGFSYVFGLLRANSPYGAELIKRPRFFNRDELQIELDNVEAAIKAIKTTGKAVNRLEISLMQLRDIRRSVARAHGSSLDEVEMFELKRFLLQLEIIAPLFDEMTATAEFKKIDIFRCEDALKLIDPDGSRLSSFFISEKMNSKLKPIRDEKRALEVKIRSALPAQATDLINKRQELAVLEENEEEIALTELTIQLRPYLNDVEKNIESIAKLDFTISRAHLAIEYNAVKPVLNSNCFEAKGMINIEIKENLEQKGLSFTPVSISLARGSTVITGANMGGKSVALKTLALNSFLVHAGLFAFSESFKTPVFSHIFMINEDKEDVSRSLSSFGGEIIALKTVLKHMSADSFIMIDEFARGTNPDEGALLARRLVTLLSAKPSFSVITTHFDNVTCYASKHYRVKGLMSFDKDEARALVRSGLSGITAIARFMDFGLIETDKNDPCPKDAENICRLLLDDNEINMLFPD